MKRKKNKLYALCAFLLIVSTATVQADYFHYKNITVGLMHYDLEREEAMQLIDAFEQELEGVRFMKFYTDRYSLYWAGQYFPPNMIYMVGFDSYVLLHEIAHHKSGDYKDGFVVHGEEFCDTLNYLYVARNLYQCDSYSYTNYCGCDMNATGQQTNKNS